MLSGNFLKGFCRLWLYILLIAKTGTNKLLFSLADLPKTGTKGGSVQCVPSGSRSRHIYPPSAHLKGRLVLDRPWRVWQQQKVLTRSMKGPLSPGRQRCLCPCPCLPSVHARSGPSHKPLMSPGKKQDQSR